MRTLAERDQTAFSSLSRDECLRFLNWETVGRLAINERNQAPFIFPVNYVAADDGVIFRTTPRQAREMAGTRISFEVDRIDRFAGTGWSVLIRGQAEVVTENEHESPIVPPWAPGQRTITMKLAASLISGRIIAVDNGPVDLTASAV